MLSLLIEALIVIVILQAITEIGIGWTAGIVAIINALIAIAGGLPFFEVICALVSGAITGAIAYILARVLLMLMDILGSVLYVIIVLIIIVIILALIF